MVKQLLLKVFVLFASLHMSAQTVSYEFLGNLNPTAGSGIITSVGPINYVPDRFNGASSSYTSTGAGTYLQLASDYDFAQRTVCVWFKATQINGNVGMIYESDHDNIVNAQTQLGVINVNGINYLEYLVGSPNTNRHREPIQLNAWYFVAIVRSAVDIKYYLNCKLVSTKSDMSNVHSISNDITNWSNRAHLCNTSNPPQANTNAYNFRGAIDEVKIFNSALNSSQIAAAMGYNTRKEIRKAIQT